ncbi:hypothetical protein CsatA_013072 [Cannabis sativa]
MGKKTLANKSKGKRPILEDYDSDFDAPLPKRGRPHSSKKTKLNVEEYTVPEISGKKSLASAEDRTQFIPFFGFQGGAPDLFNTDLHCFNLDFRRSFE